MTDELQVVVKEVLEPGSAPPRMSYSDSGRLVFESSQRWFWDLGTALTRGLAFYFAIMAVLVGYVVTKELPVLLAQGVLSLGFITSVLFAISSGACLKVLLTCIRAMETVRDLLISDSSLNDPRITAVLSSSRKSALLIMGCIYTLTLFFIVGIVVLWLHLPLHM